MIDWSRRHPGPELMDRNDIPSEHLFQNYRELHTVNKWLGGYRITLRGLAKMVIENNRTYSILDVGCGGGDMLNEILEWGKRKDLNLKLTGIDLSESAIQYSKKNFQEADWIQQDVFDHLRSGIRYDVITSTLFMHHFTADKIEELLKLMIKSASIGILINDLQRHPVAYQSIRWLTQFFSKSYLVKHDAPMSVLRGFKKEEWNEIFERAEISSFEIQWQWAFRYLIVIKK
jgi:2-polyprenyl-3-methyl-5-hydroxy-6-metoxy-1,4-benzoquinol methylase